MTLVYQSTRDEKNRVTASQAILQGLATDGGLFTPITYPQVDLDFAKLKDASYQEVAKLVLSAFLDDFSEEELDYCINHAYDSKFDDAAIAPLVKLDGQYNLELFHGATIAFKDMALSILPHLMTTAAKKHGLENKIVILTATSGDTGKAAMAGFADAKHQDSPPIRNGREPVPSPTARTTQREDRPPRPYTAGRPRQERRSGGTYARAGGHRHHHISR